MNGIAANDSTLLITVGLPNRPLCAGSGGLARTMPRRPSRLSQGQGLPPPDKGAGPNPDLEIEAVRRAADARAEIAGALGRGDRSIHRHDRVRIFRADID